MRERAQKAYRLGGDGEHVAKANESLCWRIDSTECLAARSWQGVQVGKIALGGIA